MLHEKADDLSKDFENQSVVKPEGDNELSPEDFAAE